MHVIRNASPNTSFDKNIKIGTLCSFKAMFKTRPKQYEKNSSLKIILAFLHLKVIRVIT